MKADTFKFIRDFHRIPKSQKLAWCIIHYPDDENPNRRERLGVILEGTDKAIDITDGIFIQNNARHKAMKASRKRYGDWYHYECEEGFVLHLPRYFANDFYYNRVYSRDMMESYML